MTLRIADGKLRQMPKRSARLKYTLGEHPFEDVFLAIEMDQRFDCILGMLRRARHWPVIDWASRSVKKIYTVEGDMLAHVAANAVWWTNVSLSDTPAWSRTSSASDDPAGSVDPHVVRVSPPKPATRGRSRAALSLSSSERLAAELLRL